MDEDTWRRHANPWSVWTRFAAIPLMLVAVWSRVWIGWWCLVPIAVVVIWLFVNPWAFQPVEPRGWAARGIYGEQPRPRATGPPRRAAPAGRPRRRRVRTRRVAWSRCWWPTVFGATVVVVAQLWRIDRFGWLWERVSD